MISTIRPTAAPRSPFFRRSVGFTLLEILLALALIAVLLAGVSAIVSLYSRNYTSTERRVSRAQMARSISQMLSEDLGAAVQDPIQSVADDPNRQFIRRFGLRGDSRSLQIDVVQPNLFAKTATADENRRVAEGGSKSTESRQVPELKTIFYEFVPINALEPLDGEKSDATSELDAAFGTETGGSSLTGSLSSPPGASGLDDAFGAQDELDATLDGTTGTIADGIFVSADGTTTFRPLTRKFGLSRRELDFETPTPGAEVASVDDMFDEYEAAAEEGRAVSTLTGSLSAPPDASQTTLAGSGFVGGTGALEGTSTDPTATAEAENPFDRLPLTAAQVAMDADDGTTWAPEALDCRFRYYDGENWLDSWDSIEKGGLPVAIKVDLKLAPLDDVDLYRASPLLFNLPIPPEPSAIASAANASGDLADPTALTSQLTGSLTGGPPTVAASNGPGVDVFNSYRPLAAIRIAQTAPPLTGASGATGTAASSGTESSADDELGSNALSSDLGGGLSGGFASSADAAALGGDAATPDLTGGLGETSLADSLASELGFGATAAANSLALATFNEKGICVDYANDGSYITLEGMAAELGLSQPQVFELVVYLPTTPSGRARTVERRRPTEVRRGAVAVGGPRGARNSGFSGPRTPGANPYATGTAREVRRRTPNQREFNERTAATRGASGRTAATRGAANRSAGTREGVDRTAATRAAVGRGASQRAATQRQLRTREIGPPSGNLDSELA
ncbi:MAG: prepilin-type N-terminal cleavage/methylation domain-containing protein, partial [Thermoguttaceae bacterium]|nr:prepilin-type N-terminal cleavage/methylation domain-containing protein [Thermoguttaceae bacterium]